MLNRCRRLAKDFENLTDNALAFLRLDLYPPYDAKALQSLIDFPDRL